MGANIEFLREEVKRAEARMRYVGSEEHFKKECYGRYLCMVQDDYYISAGALRRAKAALKEAEENLHE